MLRTAVGLVPNRKGTYAEYISHAQGRANAKLYRCAVSKRKLDGSDLLVDVCPAASAEESDD